MTNDKSFSRANLLPRSANAPAMSIEALAALGGGEVAYVKPMRSEDFTRLFPQIGSLQPGLNLFALVGADGLPIMLADSRDVALANAWENELQTVSLH